MHRYMRSAAVLAICSLLAGVLAFRQPQAHADSPAVVAVVPDRLQVDAFAALKRGEYDRSRDLLQQAAATTSDPKLQLMASWVSAFTSQYEQTLAGRKAEHDKAVAQAKLLLEKGYPDYALESVARAHSLAIDKAAFRAEAWVDNLMKDRAATADQFEQAGDHNKAVRSYVALAAIDQADPGWKAKLKSAARYVRIQALYTPVAFRAVQQARQTEDEKIDDLLKAAGLTRSSTTQPTTRKSDDDAATIDWRDILKGIEYDVITEATRDAVRNYYRDVDYRQLAAGGLQAIRILALTPKVDSQFPSLGDAQKRDQFVSAVDAEIAKINNAKESDYGDFKNAVVALRDANKQTVNLPENVVAYEFMDGSLAELDQFSSMIWPQQIEEFQTNTDGEFSGVGIQIQRGDAGDLEVVTPIEDTPAQRAGIKAGDRITHINGELAKGMILDQAVKKIKGKTGTRVTLTVRSPDGTVKDHTLRRDTVKVASIKGWKRVPGGSWDWIVDPLQRIGYVRLTTFSKTSADDLKMALAQMEKDGVRGVILDLRTDPGGLLNVAVDVADMFIEKGTIVSTRADRDTAHTPSVSEADPSSPKCKMPLLVLVNQFSASASEIVSGALKDQHRAIIVGERTFGKGSVQMLFPVSGRTAALKLTISRYYLPSGRCLHREETSAVWGVDPDFVIEMTPEQLRQVMEARSDMDVLHAVGEKTVTPTTKPANLMEVDPQLSAAVMLMRLQIAGAKLQG